MHIVKEKKCFLPYFQSKPQFVKLKNDDPVKSNRDNDIPELFNTKTLYIYIHRHVLVYTTILVFITF